VNPGEWSRLDPPHWLVAWTGPQARADAWADRAAPAAGPPARLLRGAHTRTARELFREFAHALSFAKYHGRSWDGLSDCLEDLVWLGGKGLILVVTGAGELLADAPDADLEMLGDILLDARDNWRHPVYERDLREDSQPFTVVLQDSESGLRSLASRAPSFQGLLEQLP